MKKLTQSAQQLDLSTKRELVKRRRDYPNPVIGITGHIGKTT